MTPQASPPATAHRLIVPGFILLGAMWGASFLFIKVGIQELHPLYLTLGRVVLGGATLFMIMLIMRERLPRDLRLWGHLAVIGVVGVAIPYSLFAYGEQHIPSLLAGIWNATTPLVALPLAALLFRTERFSLRRTVGIVLGFAGVLVVLGVWRGVEGTALTGQLMCFVAAACYGFAIPYTKRFVSSQPISGFAAMTAQMLAAMAALAIVAPLLAGAPPPVTSLSADVLASLLALGAIGTGLAFLIHYRNIRLVGATAASQVTYLIPLFAVLAGVLVLSEPIAWHQPVGAAVVLAGVAISQGSLPRWRRRTAAGRPTGGPPPSPAAERLARC